MAKWRCTECGRVNNTHLEAPNPFDPDRNISGCVSCQEANTLVLACDVTDCNYEATCGFPSENGYRNTCYKHRTEYKETHGLT